jgi:transposase-like protein
MAESIYLNKDIVDDVKSRFKYIFINYDNDEAGISYAKKMSNMYNIPYFVFPTELGKDISDIIKFYKYDKTKQIIWNLVQQQINMETTKISSM